MSHPKHMEKVRGVLTKSINKGVPNNTSKREESFQTRKPRDRSPIKKMPRWRSPSITSTDRRKIPIARAPRGGTTVIVANAQRRRRITILDIPISQQRSMLGRYIYDLVDLDSDTDAIYTYAYLVTKQ